jgi:adenylate cyclase
VARETTPAREWAEARPGSGTEHPGELPDTAYLQIERTFCFADLSGFTRFTRRESREVAARRGVRVAKWLGDGVMMVGTEPTPTIAWAGHVISHFKDTGVEIRAGLATGIVLLFEGDDYIGEPVNLAAKLCSVAEPGEILANCHIDDLPTWMQVLEVEEVDIRGVGPIGGIQRLGTRIG